MLIVSITLWILIVFFDLVGMLVNKIFVFLSLLEDNQTDLLKGTAIKNEDDNYVVEIEKTSKNIDFFENDGNRLIAIKNSNSTYLLCSIINTKILIDKIWLETIAIHDKNKQPVVIQSIKKETIGLQ